MVAAAALPGSRVEIEDVGLNPTRTALLDVLRRFGARVDVEVVDADAGEPRGTIIVEGDRTGAVDIAPGGSARRSSTSCRRLPRSPRTAAR